MRTILTDKALTLEISDDGEALTVLWLGRSVAREPRQFLQPALTRALDACQHLDKPLVLDFRQLEYVNSSTITPVVRLLQQARSAKVPVRVRYRGDIHWQRLNFSALRAFQGKGILELEGGEA